MRYIKISFSEKASIPDKQRAAKITTGWLIYEKLAWEKSELDTFVKKYSYSPWLYKTGRRVKSDVTEINFLALDFDKGSPTVEEFISTNSQSSYSWYLHTTISHTKEHNKFRVWIPLENSLKLQDYEKIENTLKNYFVSQYPTLDTSCFSIARFFVTSPNAITHLHNTEEFLQINSIISTNETVATTHTQSKKKRAEEPYTFTLDTVIRTDKFGEMTVEKFYREYNQYKIQVFCPFCIHDKEHRQHPDKTNGFIALNAAGLPVIYCSSENRLYRLHSDEYSNLNIRGAFFFDIVHGEMYLDVEKIKQHNEIFPKNYLELGDEKVIYRIKNETDFLNVCTTLGVHPNIKRYLVRKTIVFDPSLIEGDNGNGKFNTFKEPNYIKDFDSNLLGTLSLDNLISYMKEKLPNFYDYMYNIFQDDQAIVHFINWLAVIIHTRKKAYTAWVISTKTQGTGKDFMVVHLLKPLFGEDQVILQSGENLGERFNFIESNKWLSVFNETTLMGDYAKNIARKENLKNAITADERRVERKGVDAVLVKNTLNYIILSNNNIPILIDKEDRRFNVILTHNNKKLLDLPWTGGTRESLETKFKEMLPEIQKMIMMLDYDEVRADTVLNNKARQELIYQSQLDMEKLIRGLQECDPDPFAFPEIYPSNSTNDIRYYELNGLEIMVSKKAWQSMMAVRAGVLLADDVLPLLNYHFRNRSINNFVNFLKMYGYLPETCIIRSIDDKPRRVYVTKELLEQYGVKKHEFV